ncbi:hypothetical protein ACPB9J_12680 [Streptomyces lavendulocolor]|uniref:hypothetical protein n=1 Tax=Streptomyces lavendulocolor TaxID=67316 RepID=UPI003C30AE5D
MAPGHAGASPDAGHRSTLGRFATADEGAPAARPVREAAGLRWTDAGTAAITVTGLHVHRFGARAPLCVDTPLLFPWQGQAPGPASPPG